MRRELIVRVTLPAALGAACGGTKAAPPSVPASELGGAPGGGTCAHSEAYRYADTDSKA